MPAAHALDEAIARMAKKVKTAEELLQLSEAYDKLRHAGEEPKEGFAASGSDMLDCSDNFADEGDRSRRVGFRPQRIPHA